MSIHAQEASRRVRALHASHRRAARSYCERYARGTDVLSLASALDMPPCSLLRLLLETLYGMAPRASAAALRDPGQLPDPLPACYAGADGPQLTRQRLVADLQRVVAWVRGH